MSICEETTLEGKKCIHALEKGFFEEGYSSTAVLVPSDSTVTSIEELKGKKIGITQTGSTYHYMARRLLEGNGLTTKDVELVPLNSIPGLMDTLESKQVDAVLLNEPNVSRVVEEGYGKVIAQVGDEIDYQTSGIFLPYIDRDGVLLESDIQTQIDWYAKEKLFDQAMDASGIVNTELLEKAVTELGSDLDEGRH